MLWTCVDPENDPLTYDVYFGTETDPPLFDEGISNPFYDLEILNYGITYYWKIAAEDDHGNVTTGPIWSFTTEYEPGQPCPGIPTFDYGGQTYTTVQIGTQCWMAENLNIGSRIDGANDQTDNSEIEKYCYYDLDSYCDNYGGLYQWDEMMQYSIIQGVQGICPPDWHLPTDEEWKQLEGWTDSQYSYPDPIWNNTGYRGFDAGHNLKSLNGWYSGLNGSDLYGFTALPGGFRAYGDFYSLNRIACFWSCTEYNSNDAWYRVLYFMYDEVDRSNLSKDSGYSVRCLQD